MKRIWKAVVEWLNPPCPRHSGHHELEVDLGLVEWRAEFAGKTYMCEACWREIEARYAGEAER